MVKNMDVVMLKTTRLYFFLALLFIKPFLYAYNPEDHFKNSDSPENKTMLTNLGSEPTCIAGGCVNVISGSFSDHEVDLTIPAPEAFIFARAYSSADTTLGILKGGCHVNHEGKVTLISDKRGHHYEIAARYLGSYGFRSFYKEDYWDIKKPFIALNPLSETLEKGVTNAFQGVISAHTDPEKIRLEFNFDNTSLCGIRHGSSELHQFQKLTHKTKDLRLIAIHKPSGCTFKYSYDDDGRLSWCILHNRAGIDIGHFRITREKNKITVISPDERQVEYGLTSIEKDFPILTSVTRDDGPDVTYEIEKGDYTTSDGNLLGYRERIIKKNYPNQRYLSIDYYRKGHNILGSFDIQIKSSKSPLLNRVKTLASPVGEDDKPIITHSFNWGLNPDRRFTRTTAVLDAYNNHTFYDYEQQDRLTKVRKCFQATPYTEESLDWSGCYLAGRKFGLHGAHPTYQVRYHYDQNHNIVEDTITGNITGDGEQTKVKKCTYSNDHFHLLTSIKEGDLLKEFTYHDSTNLLKECFYCDSNGKILLRYFYEYDDSGMVIEMITDDGNTKDKNTLHGITKRRIEETTRTYYYPAGLPLEIKTSYLDIASGIMIPTGYQQNEFDPQGRIIQTTLKDGNHQFLRKQRWEYDACGNLIKEENSLKHPILRTYDKNGNLTQELQPLLSFYKTFSYDYSNRLIEIKEHHAGDILSQKFSYNYLGHKTQAVDPFGNVTHYEHDCFGRLLKIIGPPIDNICPQTTYEYNELSYPISVTDPNGNTTRTSYTIYGKPYKIQYPDGTFETTEYNLESLPIRHTEKNGTSTVYTRDTFGRIVKTEVFDASGISLSETKAVYNAYHLLAEIDPAGIVTTHTYDFRGRRTSIAKEAQTTFFEYDELDRVIRTVRGESVTAVKYDLLDRIIEEREEDIYGNLLKKTGFEYDFMGKKARIDEGGNRVFRYTYDTHGVLIKSVDPEGHQTITQTTYHPNIISTTTDPKGIKTVTHFNAHGKVYKTEIFDPFKILLHETHTKYDLNGNRIEVKDHPYHDGHPLPVQIQKFEYDELNRLITSIQAAGSPIEKRVSICYNKAGQKESVIKPDGIQINHLYDPLGRLKEYFSSDSSFHYRYSYDLNSNPDVFEDLIHKTKTVRTYDIYNQLISETLQNGLKVDQIRNPVGQLLSLILPDQSSANYTYQGSQVKSITRSANDEYTHRFESYDLLGQITLETLFHNIGSAQRTYTPSGHLKSTVSPFFHELIPEKGYDSKGNLLTRTIKDPSLEYAELFTYDHLNQLLAEDGLASHTYTHDSMHNRLSCDEKSNTTNILNQILSDVDSEYTYDLSGNLLHIHSMEGDRHFHYDALDRLIKVTIPHNTIEYTYDEMNRCLSRKSTDSPNLRFFYLGQIEMGACNSEGTVVQFQLLGPGRKTEPCRAVAIELDGVPYAALHDQSGHVRCLIDAEGTPKATYRYSAFCLTQKDTNLDNPYTFAGKRTDPATGYVLFGRRFYAPSMGRWITQDPAGYDTSPNLYAYLLNSPLVHYDAFGLFEFSLNTTLGHAGRMIESIINHSRGIVGETSGITGTVLHCLGRNIIPIPLLKDIPMAAGYFFQHGTLRGYTPSYSEDHSCILTAGSTVHEGIGYLINCGMGNTKMEAQELTEQCSMFHKGAKVAGVYGASHGLMADIMETLIQTAGIRTHQVKVAEKAIGLHKGSKWTSIEGHSRGGRNIDSATRAFSPEVQKTFWIGTYGSAKIIDGERFAYATNYVSNWDPVTFIADPYHYVHARFFGNPSVKFMQSLEIGFDHSITRATYRKAMAKNALDFEEFIGLK